MRTKSDGTVFLKMCKFLFLSTRSEGNARRPQLSDGGSVSEYGVLPDGDEKAGLHGMRYAPNDRRAFKHKKRRPAMKKISTVQAYGKEILKKQKLTIGVDLGDRWSFYCVLEEAGKIILALETGTHSPWVSRLLTELGHEVIVGHAQKVPLITKSNRKDDRHDARTLARLARIDPELLGPVRPS
jgi:hypothetical protein